MKNKRTGANAVFNDPIAQKILVANGEKTPVPGRDIVIKKITNIDEEWFMRIENRDLYVMSKDEQDEILNNLDIEKYIDLIQDSYERNWRNERATLD